MTKTIPDRSRIIVGYAHTPAGHAALRWAVREAQRTGAEVEVVHVFDLSRRADAILCRDREELRGEARRRAEQRVREELAGMGLVPRVRFTSLVGEIEATLAAAGRRAGRLVLGEPGSRSGRSLPIRLSTRCTAPVTVVSEAGTTHEATASAVR